MATLAELVLQITAKDSASAVLNAVAADTASFATRVDTALAKLAGEYQVLGKSELGAAAAAQAMRGAVEASVVAGAEANIARLAPALTAAGAKAAESQSLLARFGKELGSVGKMAAGMATGIIAADITMGIASRLQTAGEAFDHLANSVAGVQRLTGESAESAGLLLGTLMRYGATSETASLSIIKLQRSIAGLEDPIDIVQAGGKSGAKQLEELGIQAKDSAGHVRTASEVFLQLADVVKSKSAAEQVSLISTIFKIRGNEAAGLQRVLGQGSAAIEQYFSLLKSTGNIPSQEQVDDALAFGEAHRRLDLALQGVAVQIGGTFMPFLTKAAQVMAGFGLLLNQTVVPDLKQIPLVLPAVEIALGVLLVGAAAQATLAMGKFAVEGVAAVVGGAIKMGAALAPLIARYAAVAAAAIASAAAQVVAWLAAAGPVALIVAGIALAITGLTVAMKMGGGGWQDIGNGLAKMSEGIKSGWTTLGKLMDPTAFLAGQTAGEHYGDGVAAGIETAAEKVAKAAKADIDNLLKQTQDAAAQRKDTFELGNIENNRAALTTKLDETQASLALVESQRQLQDLDRASLDYAHQRLVINQDELATQAKIGEEKLKNAADDLSYQEKLLLAQARAAKMRGENVDMGALRSQIMGIRLQQIQNEPGLLEAGHATALADRAKSATSLTDQVAKDELDKRKIAIEEAAQPLKDELTLRTRLAENAQKLLDLNKLNFEINETYYAKDLLLAQAASKAADESYQKTVAAAAAAAAAAKGEPLPTAASFWNPATGNYEPLRAPLSSGVAGGGSATTVTVTQTNHFTGVSNDTAETIANLATDKTLEALRAALPATGTPARHMLPGAYGAGTP